MPWRPLPRIAFAIAVYPFAPAAPADLPLELGDELYIIEEGGKDGAWLRGYLVAPPSLLSGLTSTKGQTLEARVFSGIFPRSCVEIREYIGAETEGGKEEATGTRVGGGVGGGASKSGAAAVTQVNGLSPIFIDDDDFHRLPTGAPPGNVLKQPTLPSTSIESSWPPIFNGIGSTPGASPEPDGRGRSASMTEPLTPASLTPKDGRMPRPPAPVPMLKIGDETPTCANEPLVDEIASCLREWHSTNLHELLLSREYTKLAKLTRLMNRLDMARRQLLHGVLTAREVEDLHEKVVWDMVRGNKLVNNEIIVRDPRQRGRLLTASDNVNEISKLSAAMALLDAPAKSAPEPVNLHHILVEVVDVVNNLRSTQPSLLVAIYKKLPGENPVRLSESFAAEAPQTDRKSSSSRLRTLFTDLSQIDVGELSGSDTDVYVVIKVQANVPVKASLPAATTLARAPTTVTRPPVSASENDANGGEPAAAKEGGFNRAGRRSLLWGANKLNNARRRIQPPTTIEEGPSGSTPSHSGERDSSNRPTTSNNDSTSSSNGGSQSTSAQKTETSMAKRDIGVAVLKLGDLMSVMSSPQTEHTVTVYAPAEGHSQRDHENDDWNPVISEIMKSPSGRFEDCAGVTHVQLKVQSFIAPEVDDLIRRTPTALLNIHKTPKIGFPGAPKHPRSDIYITITEPVLPPNASFAHPQRGSVQLTESVDKQNLQLTLEVRRSNGKRVDHCIYPTSNSNGVTAWRTTAIQRGSAWRQTIKLSIPPEDVPDCHVIMSVADAPNFPFALAWMPLWTNGAFIEDGTHMPLLYVYDKFTSRQDNGRGAYLDIEWDSRRQATSQSYAVQSGTASTLRIETYLCSTELTQDQVVLALLNWRHQTSEQLSVILRQLPFVQESELVKLGQDIWEVLFQILTERDGQEEFEDLILNNLVFSCAIVRDRRFSKKPQIVTMYIEEDFNYPHVALSILRSLRRLFERTKDYQNSRHLNGTIKSGKTLMHLIVRSRLIALDMQNSAPGSAEASAGEAYYNEVRSLFQAFEGIMRSPLPAMIGSKALLMQHIAEWAELLKLTLRRTCLWGLALSFIDSTAGVTGKLLLHRLSMILAYCKILQPLRAEYLEEGFDLSLMDQKIHDWIAPYWGSTKEVNEQYRDQVRLCVSIVALRVTGFGEQHYPYYTKLHESFLCLRDAGRPHKHVLSPLFPTSYPFTTRAIREENPIDEALLEITSVLSSYRDKPVDPDAYTADRIMVTFEVLRSIVDGRAFPNSWLTLSLTHHRSCLFMVQKLFGVMQERHLPEPEQPELFRTDLWKSLFMSLLTIVSSENLALETFPEQKRRAVWKIAGDVREVGAGLLARCWSAIGWEVNETERAQYGLERLGGWQVQYVPHLVGPIIELCLSVHAGLRSTAVQILQSMIISEWSISGDLAVIQHAIVDCLNYLLKHKNMAENAQQKLFIVELMDLFEPLAETNDNELWEAFKDLISVVEDLLDLMVVVHSPDTSDVFRTMNTLRLMDFLRDMQKEDVFVSYVHQLADSEAQARCFKEAGLALRLHAELYEWDASKTVDALSSPVFPEQTSFERRERLYFEMIRHFEEGAAYGCALDCYRELAHHYENTSFDFAKLARTQRSMAKCHELIAKGECQTPRYFKVVYKGLGFPPNLRDKQYVFEGNGSERLITFTDRLQREHPSARLVGSTENTDGEGQYLHVTAVTPYRDLKHPLYQRGKVGFAIKEYVLSESPVNFALTTRRHSPRTGVKDQWVEKTVFTTAEVFPTILRRSEIIAEEVLPLSPIQTAIERTVRKASELWTLQTRLREGDDNSTYSLVEAIRTSVDPNSSTSVAQYREMLPKSDDRRFSNLEDEEPAPTEDPMQAALRIALFDFTYMLRHCFNTYGRSMPGNEYQKLLAQFQTTYAPEIEQLGPLPNAGSDAFNPLQISDPTFQVMPPTPTNAADFSINRTPHEEAQDTFPSNTFRDRPVLNSETRTPSRGNRLSMLLKRKPSTANSSDAEPSGSAGNPSIGGGMGKQERERSGFMRKITTAASNSSSNVNEHSRQPPHSTGMHSNQSSQPTTSRVRSPKKSPQTQQTTPGEVWGSQRQSRGEGEINGGPVYTAITSAKDAYRNGGYPGVMSGSQAGSVKYGKSRDGGQHQRPPTSHSNGTAATTSRRLAELRKGLTARRSGGGEGGPDGANDVMGVRVDLIQRRYARKNAAAGSRQQLGPMDFIHIGKIGIH